jgi:hypothetical protein
LRFRYNFKSDFALIIGALAPKALVSGARDGTTCSSFLGVRSGDILAGIAAQSAKRKGEAFGATLGNHRYNFSNLATLLVLDGLQVLFF